MHHCEAGNAVEHNVVTFFHYSLEVVFEHSKRLWKPSINSIERKANISELFFYEQNGAVRNVCLGSVRSRNRECERAASHCQQFIAGDLWHRWARRFRAVIYYWQVLVKFAGQSRSKRPAALAARRMPMNTRCEKLSELVCG